MVFDIYKEILMCDNYNGAIFRAMPNLPKSPKARIHAKCNRLARPGDRCNVRLFDDCLNCLTLST